MIWQFVGSKTLEQRIGISIYRGISWQGRGRGIQLWFQANVIEEKEQSISWGKASNHFQGWLHLPKLVCSFAFFLSTRRYLTDAEIFWRICSISISRKPTSGTRSFGTVVVVEVADFRWSEWSFVDLDLINIALPGTLADPVDANFDLTPLRCETFFTI